MFDNLFNGLDLTLQTLIKFFFPSLLGSCQPITDDGAAHLLFPSRASLLIIAIILLFLSEEVISGRSHGHRFIHWLRVGMGYSPIQLKITTLIMLLMLYVLVLESKSWISIRCRSVALTRVSMLFWHVSEIVWILVMHIMAPLIVVVVLRVFNCLRLDRNCMMTCRASRLWPLVLVVSQ